MKTWEESAAEYVPGHALVTILGVYPTHLVGNWLSADEHELLAAAAITLAAVADEVCALRVALFVCAAGGERDDVIKHWGERMWDLCVSLGRLAAELADPAVSLEDR